MKVRAWSRGDLCDCFGELALVIVDTNRVGSTEIEIFETGERQRTAARHLRRPTKAQLEREQRRLSAVVKRSKNYAAHVGLELQLRAARRKP